MYNHNIFKGCVITYSSKTCNDVVSYANHLYRRAVLDLELHMVKDLT